MSPFLASSKSSSSFDIPLNIKRLDGGEAINDMVKNGEGVIYILKFFRGDNYIE